MQSKTAGWSRPVGSGRFRLALITTLAMGLTGAAPFLGRAEGLPNQNASPIAKYLHAKSGDLIDVRIGDLHPTQAVLGYYEVFYKLGRYEYGRDALNKRFADWCEANGQLDVASTTTLPQLNDPGTFTCVVPLGQETDATIDPMKTVVIGRGGRLYLVDGHHTFTAFLESPDGGPNLHVRARVLGNLSTSGPAEFWKQMEANGWVWLRDEHNEPITVDQLPENLGMGSFRNDDYRGLIYFTRDLAYTQNAENANYQEFHWGAWLRDTARSGFNLANYDLSDFNQYLDAVQVAADLMCKLDPNTVIDGNLTANDLGQIRYSNPADFEAAWAKIKAGYCTKKPGKPAYAFKFLGFPASCP